MVLTWTYIHRVTQIYHDLLHCISFSFNMEVDLELVRDHVPQSLVVDHFKEDVSLHLPTTHSSVYTSSHYNTSCSQLGIEEQY